MFYGANSVTIRTAAMLRRDMTLAENILWEKLRDRNIFKTKFRRQHPIFKFIVDFYCHEHKLVVEVDGEIHLNKERHEYDLGRTAELNRFEITVLRFSNNEVQNNIDFVIKSILEKIEEQNPLQGAGGLP
jgi:very-short-patch-repair endonuclease